MTYGQAMDIIFLKFREGLGIDDSSIPNDFTIQDDDEIVVDPEAESPELIKARLINATRILQQLAKDLGITTVDDLMELPKETVLPKHIEDAVLEFQKHPFGAVN